MRFTERDGRLLHWIKSAAWSTGYSTPAAIPSPTSMSTTSPPYLHRSKADAGTKKVTLGQRVFGSGCHQHDG